MKTLRQDPQFDDTVVFVLTTSKSDEDIWAAYKQHIAGYMVKQDVGRDFIDSTTMLDSYWRVVEFPPRRDE